MAQIRLYFDFSTPGQSLGRVMFELFADEVPKTCENFRCLATGEKGKSSSSDAALWYRGSLIHRSIAGFMIQGGDFTKKNGTGGESIYGQPFEDESFQRECDEEGLLVMANRGPNTNGSQFFITLRPCPHLNGKHVVFGKVVKGFDIIQRIAEIPTDAKDRPKTDIVISQSGELVRRVKPEQSVDPMPAARDSLDHKRQVSPRSASEDTASDRSDAARRKRRRNDRKDRKRGDDGDRKKRKGKISDMEAVENERVETEAELDARLEREELARIAERKRADAEALKRKLAQSASNASEEGGIRMKGRGLMKYMDPEYRDRRQD